jgi:transposase
MSKKSVPYEVRLYAAKEVVDNCKSMTALASELDVHKSSIQQWVKRYRIHGEEGLKSREHMRYSEEFKIEVLEDMYKNNLSLRDVAAKYNIVSFIIVGKWDKQYKERGPDGLKNHTGEAKGRPLKLDRAEEADLIKENKRLKMEVEYLKKLNALVRNKGK